MGNILGSTHSTPVTVTMASLANQDPENITYIVASKLSLKPRSGFMSNKTTNLTHLMKLVLLTKEHPETLEIIRSYIAQNPEELEKRSSSGWTPLLLAVANSSNGDGSSSLDTVKLLLECGANVNSTSKDFPSALIVACRYAGTTSDLETVTTLCEHKNMNMHQKYIKNVWGLNTYPCNALSYAVYTDKPNIDVINFLIKCGIRQDMYIERDLEALQRAYLINK
jgi:hypothetical protein